MPPKGKLKAWLRKETKRGQSQALKPLPVQYADPEELPLFVPRSPTLERTTTNSLFDENTRAIWSNNDNHNSRLSAFPSSKTSIVQPRRSELKRTTTDSLFGESIHANKSDDNNHNSEIKAVRQNKTPVIHSKVHTKTPPSTSVSNNPALVALRKQLVALVSEELDASTKYKKGKIIKEKEELILGIGRLEREEREEKIKKLKDPFYKPLQSLPEPISPDEKKILMKQAKLIDKARTSPIACSACSILLQAPLTKSQTPSPKKRRREEEADGDDDDLDGEERLRLGIKKPRPALEMTGHWLSKVHSYMPESIIDTEEFNKWNNLTEEQKIISRGLRLRYFREAAKSDREKKQTERTLGLRKGFKK